MTEKIEPHSLTGLPPEALTRCLGYLDDKEKLPARQACKLLKEIVEITLLDIWYADVDQEIKLKLQTPFTSVTQMLNDDENYAICELLYEHVGTKDMIVRLNHRFNFNKFHELGALIVDPSTAIVSLLDHFVRSPQAATLLLGMQQDQDSMDVEVLNPDLHSLRLRNLRLPSDIIVLSVKRSGNFIITHGYTRLRKGDILTFVGSKESLKQVALKFEGA